ncbi:unnamed protein product [Blepharisma stoltei]|uniref:Kinesin motor domain-containing protein n=1 Tax=Blepharisma stoltei TaxID=1481888 RepID=A0AAU9JVP9_9CILI|nr:unnamed protein product [Blepharisma stoltei]
MSEEQYEIQESEEDFRSPSPFRSTNQDHNEISPNSKISGGSNLLIYSASDNSPIPSDIGSNDRPSDLSPIDSERDHPRSHQYRGRESAFIPSNLARDQIKMIENEMKKMHKRHCALLKEMDTNYSNIEKETHERFCEFINKWKDAIKLKVEQYRKAIEEKSMELMELKDFSESQINNFEEKINRLQQEKKEILQKYNRDMNEKEAAKERAISSMQISYEKQLGLMQNDKKELQHRLEEAYADRENIENFNRQLMQEFEQRECMVKEISEEKDNLLAELSKVKGNENQMRTEICELVLENLIGKLEIPNSEAYNEIYEKEKELYVLCRKQKYYFRNQILKWSKTFEMENKRKPDKNDKEAINELYSSYDYFFKETDTMAKRMEAAKIKAKEKGLSIEDKIPTPRRTRSQSPSNILNLSVDTSFSSSPSKDKSFRSGDVTDPQYKEQLDALQKENAQLRKELRSKFKFAKRPNIQTPTSLDANSIISNSNLQEMQALKSERDHYRQETEKLKQVIENEAANGSKIFDTAMNNLKKQNFDLKQKLTEMEKKYQVDLEMMEVLKNDNQDFITRVTESSVADTSEIANLKAQLHGWLTELKSAREKKDPNAQYLKEKSDAALNQLKKLQEENSSLMSEIKMVRDQLRRVEEENKRQRKEFETKIIQENEKHKKEIEQVQNETEAAFREILQEYEEKERIKEEKLTIEVEEMREQNENLAGKLQDALKNAQNLKQDLKDSFIQRKLLHNYIEDLKGKIRVFCRVRPMNEMELARNCSSTVTIRDDFTLFFEMKSGVVKQFSFDSIFGPQSTQEEVFEDTKKLIQSAIDGYNVCIFAYGQTGSGKTYTIQGDRDSNAGLVPRAIDEIYSMMKKLGPNFEFKLSCYMVELYKTTLIDLLKPYQKNSERVDLSIVRDAHGMVVIPETTIKHPRNAEELHLIYNKGIDGRHVSNTKMNTQSSRSHAIFSVLIEVTNRNTDQKTIGKLSFVDLAGSERIGKTEATAEGLREGNEINKSLTILGNVINALARGDSHIPYRDNKLTMLMRDSIGGSAKTLMIVNISPAHFNRDETQISLYYGAKAKQVTNEPLKNIETKETIKFNQELMEIAKERDEYKTILMQNCLLPSMSIEQSQEENINSEQISI